jgi:hypothetical protein
MSRGTHRLTDVTIKRAKPTDDKPLLLHDGTGLYLQIVRVGTGDDEHLNRTWVYRYESAGKAHRMGLGTYPLISLCTGRDLADEARRLRQAGKDPILERRQHKADEQRAALQARKMITFEEAATQYITAHKIAWRSHRHDDDWTNSLQRYAYPTLGQMAVDEVDTANVLQVLQPIWNTKTVTATRVRGRIEKILNWAAVHGYRPKTSNPAVWAGNLEHVLPRPGKIHRPKNLPAMPYDHVAGFMAKLRAFAPTAPARIRGAIYAIEFAVLTASRTKEVRPPRGVKSI